VDFVDTIDAVFRTEDILSMLGSTEKPLLEMDCGEKWPPATRPDSTAGLDGSLSSDERPLVDR
jgi:hypothetical protein